MIEFKKNVKKVLPYNREQYLNFLDDEIQSTIKWYGVSFQLNNGSKKDDLTYYVEIFESVFRNIILKLDNGSFWVINHDDKDLDWFPNDDNNLIHLRTLFKKGNVPNTFRGALIFMTIDLLEFAKEIMTYPYILLYKDALLYKNLDISHGELQFIIKVSGHLTIDLLSTDKELLRKVVNENSSNHFEVKEYRGTRDILLP